MPAPNQGMYGSMKFAPYSFKEYPKWVTREDGSKIIVLDQRSEMSLNIDRSIAPEPARSALQEQNITLAKQVGEMMETLAALRAQVEAKPEAMRRLEAENAELAKSVATLSRQIMDAGKAKPESELVAADLEPTKPSPVLTRPTSLK